VNDVSDSPKLPLSLSFVAVLTSSCCFSSNLVILSADSSSRSRVRRSTCEIIMLLWNYDCFVISSLIGTYLCVLLENRRAKIAGKDYTLGCWKKKKMGCRKTISNILVGNVQY
jgi:hypothetical protein